MGNPITINGVRFSYCNLFQATPPFNNPNGDLKYRTTILLPKSNVQAKALIDDAIEQATVEGISKKWNGTKPPMVPNPVYDGDGTRPSDGAAYGEECRGCWVFTASSSQRPFVVDANVQDILNPQDCYSGMYGNVSVTFYPYNGGGRKGIGCGLNGVQKVSDGEPLAGTRVTAKSAFSAVPPAAPVPSAASGGYPQQGGYSPAPVQNSPQGYSAAPQQGYPAQTQQGGGYPQQAQQGGYPQQNPAYSQQGAAGYGLYPQQNPGAGYGIDPNAGYGAAPGYGAASNAGYGGYANVDPNTGEVLNNGYAPSGMPIAGI